MSSPVPTTKIDANLVRRTSVIARVVAFRRAFLLSKEHDDRFVNVDQNEPFTLGEAVPH